MDLVQATELPNKWAVVEALLLGIAIGVLLMPRRVRTEYVFLPRPKVVSSPKAGPVHPPDDNPGGAGI